MLQTPAKGVFGCVGGWVQKGAFELTMFLTERMRRGDEIYDDIQSKMKLLELIFATKVTMIAIV